MDKKYITLFKELVQAVAVSAETVMEYDREKGDEKALETATIMRDDYQNLFETISNNGDDYSPTKIEAAKLLVGTMIMANQLQDKVNNLNAAMAGYRNDLIPKLQSIIDEAEDDEQAQKMANEKFIIKEEK